MAKKAVTGAAVQERVEGASPDGRGRRKRVQPGAGIQVDPEIELDRMEKVAAVCRLFSQGYTVHELRETMAERFGRAGF